jgi:hypothetical protein
VIGGTRNWNDDEVINGKMIPPYSIPSEIVKYNCLIYPEPQPRAF